MSALFRGRALLSIIGASIAVASLCACGGSTSIGPVASHATLPAAIASGCIDPTTQTQTAALPSAGGVTGTITIGALPQASSTCIGVTVATGADATLTSGTVSPASAAVSAVTLATRRRALDATAAPLPTPVAQIQLSNTYTGQLNWISISLQLPAGSVPAGSYPATITTTIVLGDGQTSTTTTNFTVIVAANGSTIVTAPNLQNLLAVLNADTTGVLTIYPAGTVLPNTTPVPTDSPTPVPTPSASASASAGPTASATPTATAAPTATPTLAPTATPLPSATPTAGADCQSPPYGSCGTAVFGGSFDGGPNAGQLAAATPEPITSNNSAIILPGQYFDGTVVLTLSTYHPGAQQVLEPAPYNTHPCPASQLVQSGPNGDTYTLTLNGQQYDLPAEGNGLVGCILAIGPKDTTGSGQGYDQFINIYYPPV